MALKYYGTAAFEHATSLELVDNVYQDEIYIEGKAFTGKYATAADTSAQDGKFLYLDIQRNRVVGDTSRKLDPTGALPNSGLFNVNNTQSGSIQVNSQIYTLMVDEMLDASMIIPKLAISINGLNRIEGFAKTYRQSITRTINISRTAHYLFAFIMGTTDAASLARNVFNYPATLPVGPTGLPDRQLAYEAFMAAVDAGLDGDISNGFQSFPPDRQQIVVKPWAKTDLGRAHLNNASDIATQLMANGMQNPFDPTKEAIISLPDGKFGQVDGVLIAYMANDIWVSAYKYLGIFAGGTWTQITALTTKILDAIGGIVIAADACFSGRVFQGVESGIDPFTRATVLVPDDRFGMEIISPFAVRAVTKLDTPLTLADFTAAQAEIGMCLNPASQPNYTHVYN